MSIQERPVVSIITVCFNDREGLERTIRSVVAQEGVRIEHILVDGGSTDGSLEVIREHEAGLAKWISEPDKGPYDGMNKGLEMATGDWVHFLNAGDILYQPDSLLSISKFLQREDVVAVYGDSLADYGDFRVYRKALPFSGIWKGMVFSHQALFLRASKIGHCRFDLRHPKVADYDFVLRCIASGDGVVYEPVPLVVCDAHGISNRGQAIIVRSYYSIAREHYPMGLAKKAYFAGRFITLGMIDLARAILPQGTYLKLIKGIKKGGEV